MAELDRDGDDDKVHQDPKAFGIQAVRKRRLYRHVSGHEVPWFPHDNSPELIRELVHESGEPRWVMHGTPASGAGVLGCIESGCSVLLLAFDEHHEKTLMKFLEEMAVEAMVSGNSSVFRDEGLIQRAAELNIGAVTGKDKDDKEKKRKQPDEDDEKEENKNKKHKNQKGKKDKKETPRKKKKTSVKVKRSKRKPRQDDTDEASQTDSSSAPGSSSSADT